MNDHNAEQVEVRAALKRLTDQCLHTAGDDAGRARVRKDGESVLRALDLLTSVEKITWFPAIQDAISGRTRPPVRKVHVRVRDLDAAMSTPPGTPNPKATQ